MNPNPRKIRGVWIVASAMVVTALVIGGAIFLTQNDAKPTVAAGDVSLSVSPTPSPVLSEEDKAQIEDSVRSYFQAYAGTGLARRIRMSTGDIQDWALWHKRERDPEQPVGRLTIDELSFRSGGADKATVDFKATLSYPEGGLPRRFTGPVEVLRTDEGWKVSDYARNGRSQKNAVYTKIRGGYQESNRVGLEVLGVVIQEDYTNVFVKITNRGQGSYSPYEGQLVTANGQQFSNGLVNTTSVVSRASVVSDLFWPQRLPVGTKQLRVVLDGSEDVNFNSVDFDMSLRLLR